jgi:hypothetical protein
MVLAVKPKHQYKHFLSNFKIWNQNHMQKKPSSWKTAGLLYPTAVKGKKGNHGTKLGNYSIESKSQAAPLK